MDDIASKLSGAAFEPADLELMGALFDAAAAIPLGRRNVIAVALLEAVAAGERRPGKLRYAINEAVARDHNAEVVASLQRRMRFSEAA